MKRAKSIFLWCCEQGAQWRGWLPYWGFSKKMFEHQSKNTAKIGNQKRVVYTV